MRRCIAVHANLEADRDGMRLARAAKLLNSHADAGKRMRRCIAAYVNIKVDRTGMRLARAAKLPKSSMRAVPAGWERAQKLTRPPRPPPPPPPCP
eukprot:CAMPEP_0179235098 /NCGR_PEP_ID=MMETSP0797-20121207/13230_1 /TAXON_ID=47934 /ORGANISM="Dinophysis acuminata, Strain DAEP01" /LENGTH=94 /DNA_ID=CAMNT_0020942299 /DNA_START=176 /DNA_END=457 /DNA_ORIENTATION=-